MRIIKNVYVKTYEDLQKRFSTLFWCIIHMPYEEFRKIPEQEILSLKIRGNRMLFEEV